LLYTDPFSFTEAGRPWIAQWWLGECLLAGLARLGGLDMILLATATALAAFFTWIYCRFLKEGMDALLAVLFTALAFLNCTYHLHPRPHLITIFLIAWTQAKLTDFEAGRISLARLFWLAPLFVF